MRIKQLFWLGGVGDELYTDLSITISNILDPDFQINFSELFGFENNKHIDDPDELIEFLSEHGKYGFLAEIQIPIRSNFTEGCYSCSWAFCESRFIYADYMEELVEKAINIFKTCEAAER